MATWIERIDGTIIGADWQPRAECRVWAQLTSLNGMVPQISRFNVESISASLPDGLYGLCTAYGRRPLKVTHGRPCAAA